MGYEAVGTSCAENLKLLQPDHAAAVVPANQAMWNLSNALMNLSAAVEKDIHDLHTEVRALRQEITRLSQKR
jgi:hypothetical protein